MIDKIQSLMSKINEVFSVRKKIMFEGYDLEIELGSPTSIEETKILEACLEYDGGSYIEALKRISLSYSIKRINDVSFEVPYLEYKNESGEVVREAPNIYLSGRIKNWPPVLTDSVFSVYQNILEELEAKIKNNIKFERFIVSPEIKVEKSAEPGIPDGFSKVDIKDDSTNETDKLNEQVEKERSEVELAMTKAEEEAHGGR